MNDKLEGIWKKEIVAYLRFSSSLSYLMLLGSDKTGELL
jgi:hypothetical protein